MMAEQDVLDAIAALPTDADVQAAVAAALLAHDPPAGTNYCTYPSMETDAHTDTLADGWSADLSTVTGTPVYSKVPGRLGGVAQRIQYTGVAGDSAGNLSLTVYSVSPYGSFASGDTVTVSCYVKCATSGVTPELTVLTYSSGSVNPLIGFIGYAGDTIPQSTEWTRVSVSLACAATTNHVVVIPRCFGDVGTGDTIDITIDDVLIEKSPFLTPYFDGSYADCSWTGTANASTSTRSHSVQVIAETTARFDVLDSAVTALPTSVWATPTRALTDKIGFDLAPTPLAFMWTNSLLADVVDDFPAMKAMGVDVVHNYLTWGFSDEEMQAWLDALLAAGLKAVVNVAQFGQIIVNDREDKVLTGGELTALGDHIDQWKTHPAVWGWYATDEGWNYPVATGEQVYDTIKAHDSLHPVMEFLIHPAMGGPYYSPTTHDVVAYEAGVGVGGAVYVYRWDWVNASPQLALRGCVSPSTGLVSEPAVELAALEAFAENMASAATLFRAAGETQVFVVLQACGNDPDDLNQYWAMPPPHGISKMWSKVRAAGLGAYGVGFWLWDSSDSINAGLLGVDEVGYEVQRSEVAATISAVQRGTKLETLDDKVDGAVAAIGAVVPGATPWTYALTLPDTTPIPDAHVWVTTDETGTNVVGSTTTDNFGVARFYLDAGIYYVWSQKSGYNFTCPDLEVVS